MTGLFTTVLLIGVVAVIYHAAWRHALLRPSPSKENPMTDLPEPPVMKYKFTAVIRGNTHAEIVEELVALTRGGYLLASDYETRDEFDSYGGRDHIRLEHTNPDQTPEQYAEQLSRWSAERKAARAGSDA